MTKVKAIIFDFDGTLFDDFDKVYENYCAIGATVGFKFRDKEQFRGFLSMNWVRNYKRMGISLQKANRMHNKAYRKMKAGLFPGVKGMLSALGKKYRLAVVSSSQTRMVWGRLRRLGIAQHFRVVVGAIPSKLKPNPAQFLVCMKKLNVKPGEVASFGDTIYDVMGARNAKIKYPCAVSYGFEGKRMLQRKHPLYVAKKVSDIPSIIRKIENG